MRKRHSARALLVCDGGSILLMKLHVGGSDGHIWIAPGGGIKPTESTLAALRREIFEETGNDRIIPGPAVWSRRDIFELNGEQIDQSEEYFLCPCDRFEPLPVHLEEGDERESFRGFKWWTIDEIRCSSEVFVPRTLAENLSTVFHQNSIQPFVVGR